MVQDVNPNEWEGASEEAPTLVDFNEFGDRFLGIFLGSQEITNPNPDDNGNYKTWQQWLFTGILPDELADERCGINGTFELDKKLKEIPIGYEVQLTYVKDIPTHKGNPLKSFNVRWRKAQHRTVSAT